MTDYAVVLPDGSIAGIYPDFDSATVTASRLPTGAEVRPFTLGAADAGWSLPGWGDNLDGSSCDPSTFCPRDHGCSLPAGHDGNCSLTAALCFCAECEARA